MRKDGWAVQIGPQRVHLDDMDDGRSFYVYGRTWTDLDGHNMIGRTDVDESG